MRTPPKMSRLSSSLMAAGVIGLSLSAGVRAQTAAPKAAPSTELSQEVVITAQKISQLPSKTAIALTVISGEGLKEAGVVDIRDLTDAIPNVQISQERGVSQINIRGVMAVDHTERGDPSNAFHIDGVYIGRPEATLGAFLDVDRVEVLRGPQGTLYGKNATGGAINVISNKPVFKREGKLTLDVGNYGALRTEGVVNEPFSDSVALRLAFGTTKHNSYLKRDGQSEPTENQNDNALRGSVLWKLAPKTTLQVTGERTAQAGAGFTPLPIRNFYDGVGVGRGITQAQPDDIQNPVYVDRGTGAALSMGSGSSWLRKTHKDNKTDMLRTAVNSDLGWSVLSYDFGYLKGDLDYEIAGPAANGAPGGGGIIGFTKMQFTQSSHELRLASAGSGPFKWVGGLFHTDEKITTSRRFLIDPPDTVPALFDISFANKVKNTSDALFGQATYSVLPQTRLVLGARSSRDQKAFDPFNPATGAPIDHRDVTFTKSTYRLGAEQDLAPNVMAYATYSTGYKAGGFNDTNPTSPIIRPENLKSFELGLKGRFLENRLQLSAALYHYDYKDMQVTGVYCLSAANCGAAITINGNGAKIQGLEIEGRFRLTGVDEVNFAAGYNDAKYNDFKSYSTSGAQTWDISGQQLDRAPKGNLSLSYAHDFGLPNGASLKAMFGTKYTTAYLNSSYSADAVYRYPQKAFTKTDTVLTYTPAVGNYYVQGYVKNIENKVQVVNILTGAVNASAPRTFGVRFGSTF